MTMALIVACKDSFYIISDTLSNAGNVFSLSTKKSFFSIKHKLGLCISGDADLKPKNHDGISTENIINVDYS